MNFFKFTLGISLYLIFAFIGFTVVGTLSHELGHIVVAKYLGYKTYLSYGSMTYYQKGYQNDNDVKEFEILNDQYLKDGITMPEQLETDELSHYNNLMTRIAEKFPSNRTDNLLIAIGGPAQTVLTCLIGLFILFYRRSTKQIEFKFLDWLGVFLSLFILREVFNTVMAIRETIINGDAFFVGDEFTISSLLGLNHWVIPIITMVVGLVVSVYVIFKVIPHKYRFSFIISGLIGGVLGYSIWFGFLGRLLFQEPISF